MNCMEFQRELSADPRRLSKAALDHAEICPDCARRLAGQINLDAQLDAELQSLHPVGMEDRILLATRISGQKRQRFLALAATLVIGMVVVFGITVSQRDHAAQDLVTIAVEHVLAEPEHLQETQIVDAGRLNRLLARVGAQTRGALPVTYANACVLPNGEGGHIVLSTPHGRVTLMLIPNAKTDSMLHRTTAGYVVEVHSARTGSYSLVAPNESSLTDAKILLANQLRWT